MHMILSYAQPNEFCQFVTVLFSVGPFPSDVSAQEWARECTQRARDLRVDIRLSESSDELSDKHFDATQTSSESVLLEMQSDISFALADI